jgi:methylthioribulose-1-phosphate dehydratase
MVPDDIFEYEDGSEEPAVIPAPERGLRPSQCTPLFFNAFRIRNAGACIHTHSQNTVLVSMLWQTCYTVSHQEMIKVRRLSLPQIIHSLILLNSLAPYPTCSMAHQGVVNDMTGHCFQFFDTIRIPIIENTPHERDLKESMAKAMIEYPEACAVLVRRHGVYVWGASWEQAKTTCECLDYLFELSVKMKQLGIDPEQGLGRT